MSEDMREMAQASISELVAEVQAAEKEYNRCKEAKEIASTNEIAALNRLNQYQQAFDRELAKIRKAAPYESDWKRAARDLDAHPVEG